MARSFALVLLAGGFSLSALSSYADEEITTVVESDSPFVRISLCTDLDVLIRLEEISSVSIHKYRLNGAIPMLEVTIDIKGQNAIRFYYTSAKDKVCVTKHYPDGVHSHTIDYSVGSRASLKLLYKNVFEAMVKGEGAQIDVSPGSY